jgi:superoxide dismutase, Fe-Mn family
MHRRDMLTGGLLLAAGGFIQPAEAAQDQPGTPYTLPPLAYSYDALEPHIDAQTMRLHHSVHHQSYVDGLNRALDRLAAARASGEFDLVKHWSREVGFHGAGHLLHDLFWTNMSPSGGGEPGGALARLLTRDFGGFTPFREHFSAAARQVEGSGWALLAWEPLGQRLLVTQAEKHQNLTPAPVIPLLALDVWEHAYYLRYQSRRAEYVQAWWNVVNWPDVERRLGPATGRRPAV